jgi:chromosome segregation ATPase
VDFVSSYRKILANGDVHAEKVEANNARRKAVENQIPALEDEMKALEEEAQELEAGKKQMGLAKKRLRESLAEKERALLELGVEMGEREKKRAKLAPGSRARSKSEAITKED